MVSHTHRRQVLLFHTAVVLPCTVLVALGLRMFGQEQELREKRLADERDRITTQLNRELSARLEAIELQTAVALTANPDAIQSFAYADPAVVLVGRVENGTLRLPWELDPRPGRAQRLLNDGVFADAVAGGERAEFGDRDLARALARYGEAREAARDPLQVAQAELLIGRVSWKAGQRREANRHYLAVHPADVIDENGIELWCYAATRLVEAGLRIDAVLARLQIATAAKLWRPPTQLYMLRALVDSLIASDADSTLHASARLLQPVINERIETVQHALEMQRDFTSLPLSRTTAQPEQRS